MSPNSFSFLKLLKISSIFAVFLFSSLLSGHGAHDHDHGHKHDDDHDHQDSESGNKLDIIGQKGQFGVNIASVDIIKSGDDSRVVKEMACSICSSVSPDGMNEEEVKRLNAVGHECVHSPEKFIRNCNQWRDSLSTDQYGSVNKSVTFTGCYKTVFNYDYDLDGKPIREERVVRRCGFLGTPSCSPTSGFGTHQIICYCTEFGCNSAFRNLLSSLAIFMSVAVFSINLSLF